jgi:hypothetical protein
MEGHDTPLQKALSGGRQCKGIAAQIRLDPADCAVELRGNINCRLRGRALNPRGWRGAEKGAGPSRPRTRFVLQLVLPSCDDAYAACGPQIFILRVSGIKNRLSTKHIAGTAIG